jgi:hypothetical protein
MGRPDGLFKTRETASLKLGHPDSHDGRPDGLRLHRFLPSRSPILARPVRRRPDRLRTGCERDSERSSQDLVLKSLIASRPNGYEFRPNAWLFSFHFAHEH